MNQKRSVLVELDADDARYILHALLQFKSECKNTMNLLDEDDDLVSMYGNDIMMANGIYEKVRSLCEPVFGSENLIVSHDLL
jgi:hypothetical protein